MSTVTRTRDEARVVVPVLALSVSALALRDVGVWSFVVPVAGALGVLAAQPATGPRSDRTVWLCTTAVGMAACAAVRLALPGAPIHATTLGLLASAAAAVGEEIVFRRGLYGWLERWGTAAAIVASALVFGLVHAPMYGWTVVPVDVGAGLVFGWQRWASGGWTSPAATHVFANLAGAL
jgi:membrane protease YdiL (CAAX protease family)